MRLQRIFATIVTLLCLTAAASAEPQSDAPPVRKRSNPPVIQSSWDDLLEGVKTQEDWRQHRKVLKQRYLDLIRDDQKPAKPPLDLKRHESTVVEGLYTRWLVSYNVEADERTHAYLGIPLKLQGKLRPSSCFIRPLPPARMKSLA